MSVFERVRDKANESSRGFITGSPTDMYNELVGIAYTDLNNSIHHAKHSRYDEMYHPLLGQFRERRMYTSLAPSLCIQKGNRACSYYETPHKAYATKQGEWLVEKDRKYTVRTPRQTIYQSRSFTEPAALRNSPRCYTLPTSTTRVDNYFLYWKGRACGLDYIAPFLASPDYRPAEDRRYNRIYWASGMMNDITPSCRHATNFMLSAY